MKLSSRASEVLAGGTGQGYQMELSWNVESRDFFSGEMMGHPYSIFSSKNP